MSRARETQTRVASRQPQVNSRWRPANIDLPSAYP
jgi:hypothetical protein